MSSNNNLSLHDQEVLSLLRRATPEERRALAKLMAENLPAPVDENEQDPLKLLKGLHEKGDGDYGYILLNIAHKFNIPCKDIIKDAPHTGMFQAEALENRILATLLKTLKKDRPDDYRKVMQDAQKQIQEQGSSIAFEEAAKAVAVTAGSFTTRMAAGFLLTRVAASTIAGPIGWAAAAILSGAQIYQALSGPAYKVTLPAVLHIAVLRKRITNPAPRPAAPLADI